MEDICSCGKPLRDAITLERDDGVLKSCPECSGRAGRHVFYREDDFGTRDMGDGRVIPQSWCPTCRSDSIPSTRPAFECD